MRQHTKLLIGMLAGIGLGLLARWLGEGSGLVGWVTHNVAVPLGTVFLRLLFMLVVPLLFSALVVGVSDLEVRHLGRMGLRTLAYTVVVSTISVLIGMTLVNVFKPSEGLSPDLRGSASAIELPSAISGPSGDTAAEIIVSMVPANPVQAAASGDMIGLLIFSILFGIGLALTPGESAGRLKEVIGGLFEVMMRLIAGVLRLAPLGVGALLFTMTIRLGTDLLTQLLAYVLTVVAGLAIHGIVVYSLSVRFLGGMSPLRFFKDVRLAMVTAFSTASSNASLPMALKVAEENLKLPPHVSRFVLTAGAAMNQNGTALFEGLTVLFLAQLYGVDLTLGDQALVMFIAILGGIGTAGVPAGSLPVVALILGMFEIPVEGIGLILGVDRFLDMCRTTLNVTGDLAAAVVVSRGEPMTVSGEAEAEAEAARNRAAQAT